MIGDRRIDVHEIDVGVRQDVIVLGIALGDAELATLLTRLEAAPDATLDAHLQWWNAQHPEHPISRATLDRAITRLGWSRKKSRSARVNVTKMRVPPSASN